MFNDSAVFIGLFQMFSRTWEIKPSENDLNQVLSHSSGKEEKRKRWHIENRPRQESEFCAFLFSLFKQFSIALPWLKRTSYKDLSAAHADESDLVCFVTKFIAFLISHNSLSSQNSNYKIQRIASPDIQGSSALQFVLLISVPWFHACNFISTESLSHYPFSGTLINIFLPLKMIGIYLSQQG